MPLFRGVLDTTMALIVGHRGAPKLARENTIESFLSAVSLGAEMIELDVRRTADGVPVVFHDAHLSRRSPASLLKRLTYAEITKWTSRRGFAVPTLEETLTTLSGKIMLDIELKEPGYEEEVVALAIRHFAATHLIFSSFDPATVSAVRAAAPQVTTGFLLATPDAFPLCPKAAADVLAPEHHFFRTHHDFFSDAKRSGVRIVVWTVDDALQLRRLLADPIVDAVITNYPDRAMEVRRKLNGIAESSQNPIARIQ